MGDDLDDLLNSALDEVALDEQTGDVDGKEALSEAAKAAADVSAQGAKAAEDVAAKAAATGAGPGMENFEFDEAMFGEMMKGIDGFDGNALEEMIKGLNDPEFAKTFEETLKMVDKDNVLPEGGDEGVDSIIKTLKGLSEAAKGLEGEDAAQAEQAGGQIMSEVMKDFEEMGSADGFSELMEGMVRQMLSKDVMYGPIKKVVEKYPEWLADNEEKLPKDEYERYGNQYQYYQRIVEVYETEPDNFARISELFQEMQEFGQPPVEIVKDLAPGLEIGEDGMPRVPAMGPGGMPGMPPMGPGGMPPGLDPNSCPTQ